jgi:hypothetical protein
MLILREGGGSLRGNPGRHYPGDHGSVMRLIRFMIASGAILICGTLAAATSPQIRDLAGRLITPFKPDGLANVLFFIATDCPISNSYAPVIQGICREYESKGVRCSLYYEDIGLTESAARKHLDEYRYQSATATIDAKRTIANRAMATVTPQAVVVDQKGDIRYRGRIDNFYAALGKPRQQVTVHDLTDALNAVLAGKAVENPETKALGCYIVDPKVLNSK